MNKETQRLPKTTILMTSLSVFLVLTSWMVCWASIGSIYALSLVVLPALVWLPIMIGIWTFLGRKIWCLKSLTLFYIAICILIVTPTALTFIDYLYTITTEIVLLLVISIPAFVWLPFSIKLWQGGYKKIHLLWNHLLFYVVTIIFILASPFAAHLSIRLTANKIIKELDLDVLKIGQTTYLMDEISDVGYHRKASLQYQLHEPLEDATEKILRRLENEPKWNSRQFVRSGIYLTLKEEPVPIIKALCNEPRGTDKDIEVTLMDDNVFSIFMNWPFVNPYTCFF